MMGIKYRKRNLEECDCVLGRAYGWKTRCVKKHVNSRTFASSHKYIYRRSPVVVCLVALECRASLTILFD